MAQPGERWLYNTGALGPRRAARPRGRHVLRRGAADAHLRAARHEQHRRSGPATPTGWPTAYRPGPDGLGVWDAPDGRWSRPPAFEDGARRPGLDRRRPARVRPDAPARRGRCPVGGRRAARCAPISSRRRRRRTADSARTSSPASRGRSARPCTPTARSAGTAVSARRGWSTRSRDLIVIVLTQRMFDSPALPSVHRDMAATRPWASAQRRGRGVPPRLRGPGLAPSAAGGRCFPPGAYAALG